MWKADKNADADFTSCLALREGKTTHSQPKAETNRTTESLLLSTLSVLSRFSTITTTTHGHWAV